MELENRHIDAPQKLACVCFARGCPRSKIDAILLIDYLKINGWGVTNKFKKADMILIATCGVTRDIEDNSIKIMSVLNRMKKRDARLFAFGCLPAINGKRLLDEFHSDIFTRGTLERLDSIIDATVSIRELEASANLSKYDEYLAISVTPLEWLIHSPTIFMRKMVDNICSKRAFDRLCRAGKRLLNSSTNGNQFEGYSKNATYSIRISTGCMESCSYCAIRFATTGLKSIPLESVLRAFDRGLEEGYTLFGLLGEDIGAYGQDIGCSIVTLLREIFRRENDFQISLDDFHPRWLVCYFQELSEILVQNAHKIVNIAFPIQSGSNRILQLMRREYEIEAVQQCLNHLKTAAPHLSIETHLLVGFPGETEDDFNKTLELLESVNFSKVCLYQYSDRSGAPAVDFPDKIPDRVIKRRSHRIKRCRHR